MGLKIIITLSVLSEFNTRLADITTMI